MVRIVSVGIEILLNKDDITGEFNNIKHWYKKFTGTSINLSPGYLEGYTELFKT